MRATIILVLLALMMSMTIEVDGLAFSPEQTNEDAASEVSVSNDDDLSEKLINSWQYLESKRALGSLQFPGDCNAKTLRKFANKCSLKVEAGGSHWKVYDGRNLLTTIPHKVKVNGTCRNIINTLNDRC